MGWDVKKSAEFANAVATHCIMAIGASTAIPTVDKVIEFMETHTAG
jgi:sugar/nucleoside kinase (ribokinase family)